ncbi:MULTISPECIES: nucleoside triphosphate pyrophosphohydrolase [Henriciella]|jgi:ATP diphosphatase|uniref:Nucleoside triphosphate pyrophosphohydrolase n=1 Tax=Henriciella pelagia TaxID=1977912 RepID=A0ABQ1J681_9PROT|nr:nucleoside triphosphate pyrophosphohydrolase [Henriciella pelagia]GGB58826.1 nucleoside triphosphate pyrophosphohydrolase [Henriciella pelagia]
MSPPPPSSEFDRLRGIMAKLRDPETGCPWDVEQSFSSISPYTIEEAYEVADAIEREDYEDLRDELGDLLLQVVFHSQMASEAGLFTVDDVARAINDKMVRRHPHVFRNGDDRTAEEQTRAWEDIKASERSIKDEDSSALAGVAKALPALMRAEKLQKRAARTGFDWTNPEDILEKLAEETDEVQDAIENGNLAEIEDEIGDLLFVTANLARRFKLDPEIALRKANDKFERRFRAMEALAATENKEFSSLGLSEQDALWTRVKMKE